MIATRRSGRFALAGLPGFAELGIEVPGAGARVANVAAG